MNPYSRLRSLIVVGVLLPGVSSFNADTLVLRDGRRVQGQLITFRDGIVEFQDTFGSGRTVRLNRDQVMGIEFDRNDRNPNGSLQPPERQASQDGRPRGLREKQLMAAANVQWTDTGIDVSAGQNIYFEASGEIRWGPNRRASPGGEENSPNNPSRPMPNRPGASLIGRVGPSQDYFYVGDDRGAIRMRSSGRLFVGINDDNLQDNTGYFRVIVYY